MDEVEAGASQSALADARAPVLLPESNLVFPATAADPSEPRGIHSVAGRLCGRESRRQWAFLVLFWNDRPSQPVRADHHTLALFDLDTRDYGTSTESRRRGGILGRRADPSPTSQGRLAVSFQGHCGEGTWRTHGEGEGSLLCASSALRAVAVDAGRRVMKLDLAVTAGKPLLPLGGYHPLGATMLTGPQGMRGSFRSGVRFSGRLEWGETHEDVDGDGGWIAHRFASRALLAPGRFRGLRDSHEWRRIQLADGTEISVWQHFDRRRGNRPIPPSTATAIAPNGEVTSTSEFHLERLSFVRDPPAGTAPSSPGPARYLVGGCRVSVPAWNLDLVSEPLVAAPAYELPIPHWSAPTRVTGRLDGVPVSGFGFDERTHALSRDFELVELLRETLRRLPADALTGGDLDAPALADLAWGVDGFVADDDPEGALRHLASRVRPAVDALAEPHRTHALAIADDAAEALLRWWVRP